MSEDAKDADVDRLTPEQIEAKRSAIQAAIALVEGMSQHWMEERWKAANDLCDLALQSLSQEAVREAVRDEALDEAANELERAFAEADTLNLLHGAARVRALKREPNAAAQGGLAASQSVAGTDHAGQASPAPAAPDVASMVKRLNDISEGREGRIAHIFKDCREAAALLAKLGQGWIPVREDLRTIDKELDHGIDD